MIFLLVIILVLGSVGFSFFRKAKFLEINPLKWVLIGLSSFLFFTIPIWLLLTTLISYIFTENNILFSLIRIIIFILISGFVRNFLYKKMEDESTKVESDENLLDDIEF